MKSSLTAWHPQWASLRAFDVPQRKRLVTRILVIFCAIVVAFANVSLAEMELDNEPIIYEEGVWPGKRGFFYAEVLELDFVPDMETAVAIAQLYISNYLIPNGHMDLAPRSVFYDVKDKLWIVMFAPKDPNTRGGALLFAIRRNNGQVMKIWGEE